MGLRFHFNETSHAGGRRSLARGACFVCLLALAGFACAAAILWVHELRGFSEQAIEARIRADLLAANAAVIFRNEKPATLVFVGDIMLSRAVGKKIEAENDPHFPFLNVADALRSADLAFANLEGPISSRGKDQGSEYSFRADPGVIEGLKFAGFDVLSLANNHIWDWGSEALEDTVNILKENGIQPTGAGKNFDEANAPAIFVIGNTRLAMFAYTTLYPRSLEATAEIPGISAFQLEKVADEIKRIKGSKTADIVIVSLHWGEEYVAHASEEQKDIAHVLVDAGADLVIGHHPHVVQEVERYKSRLPAGRQGWIAYSLGNFVFDQGFSKETMAGLMLKATVRNKEIFSVETVKTKISRDFEPYIEP